MFFHIRKNDWLCPFCGRAIAKRETNFGSAKGLLVIHTRAKHPLFYQIVCPNGKPD
jgi:hypothetical protein